MSRDCCVALPHSAMGLSAVCDCGINYIYEIGKEHLDSRLNIKERGEMNVNPGLTPAKLKF